MILYELVKFQVVCVSNVEYSVYAQLWGTSSLQSTSLEVETGVPQREEEKRGLLIILSGLPHRTLHHG